MRPMPLGICVVPSMKKAFAIAKTIPIGARVFARVAANLLG